MILLVIVVLFKSWNAFVCGFAFFFLEQGNKGKDATVDEKVFKDEELVNLIDPILNIDDWNKDGYIDYPEFIRAQQKATGQAKPQA